MIIKQNRGRQWLDWQRRMLVVVQALGAGACVWLVVALFVGEMGLPRYWSMRDHAGQLEGELMKLKEANAALRSEISGLQHSGERIEQLARERLGYVRKGETVYQLAPEPPAGRTSQDAR